MNKSPDTIHIPASMAGNDVLNIKSSSLFCHARSVCIEHSGQRYLLRLTRENKLILTK